LKRAIPLLAVTLGAMGVVMLLGGVAGIWYAGGAAVERVQRLATRATERLTKVAGNLQRLDDKVRQISIDLNKVKAEVARLVERKLSAVLAQTELQQLGERVRGLLDQGEDVAVTMHLVADMMEDLAELLEQLEGREDLTAGIKQSSDTIDQAATALLGLRQKLDQIQWRDETADPRQLTEIVELSRGPIERLADAIGTIRQRTEKTHAAFDNVAQNFAFWSRGVAVIVSLIAAWFVWAQVCLLRWGWARLNAATAAPGSE